MRFSRFLTILVIAVIIAFVITAKDDVGGEKIDFSNLDEYVDDWSEPDEYDDNNEYDGYDETDSDRNSSEGTTDNLSFEFTTYYEQLTDYQKQIYNVFLNYIPEGEDEIIFDGVNVDTFNDDCYAATIALQYDHPEYFWFTGAYSYEASYNRYTREGSITLAPDYYEYARGFFNFESKLDALESAVKDVAAKAINHSSVDYERIIFVHDYLTQNAYYDNNGLEEYYETSRSPSCEYIFSAYGCLVNGKTVCSGYAKAFQLIMRELGYDCIYVVGDAGEAHGWNCVFLNGEGYYVDVTWDDFDLSNNEPFYNYCFITSEALARTHTLDTVYKTPICTATEYEYFIYRNYYTENYSFEAVSDIIERQSGNGAAHIQFGSLAELERACKDLIDNKKFKTIPGTDSYTRYYRNDDHYTISFYDE